MPEINRTYGLEQLAQKIEEAAESVVFSPQEIRYATIALVAGLNHHLFSIKQ